MFLKKCLKVIFWLYPDDLLWWGSSLTDSPPFRGTVIIPSSKQKNRRHSWVAPLWWIPKENAQLDSSHTVLKAQTNMLITKRNTCLINYQGFMQTGDKLRSVRYLKKIVLLNWASWKDSQGWYYRDIRNAQCWRTLKVTQLKLDW